MNDEFSPREELVEQAQADLLRFKTLLYALEIDKEENYTVTVGYMGLEVWLCDHKLLKMAIEDNILEIEKCIAGEPNKYE